MNTHLELTKREWEILILLATTGMQRQELADTLNVSLATINTHLNRIFSKLGVTNNIEAVIYFYSIVVLGKINRTIDDILADARYT